jgi:hypothetical protein
MKTLILTAALTLVAVSAAQPAAAKGGFPAIVGNAIGGVARNVGNAVGAALNPVHQVRVGTPSIGGVATTRTPIHIIGVPAPQPVHVAPPPGQSVAGRVGTFAPPPPPVHH